MHHDYGQIQSRKPMALPVYQVVERPSIMAGVIEFLGIIASTMIAVLFLAVTGIAIIGALS